MTPTRADLERLIETWRKEAAGFDRAWHANIASAFRQCADELAALLTSEGPAPTTDARDDALRNIAMSARRGRAYGSSGVPALGRQIEYHHERFDDILRFCAEAGHMGSILRAAAPKPLAVYRCRVCGTRWLFWGGSIAGLVPGTWNLLDQWQRPGACCDNAPMGEQMEFLRDIVAPAEGPETPANTEPREIRVHVRQSVMRARMSMDLGRLPPGEGVPPDHDEVEDP